MGEGHRRPRIQAAGAGKRHPDGPEARHALTVAVGHPVGALQSFNFSGTIRMAQVSIITTCFNQAGVIARCLESVTSQSVPPLECIVVDDGSTIGDVQDTVARIGNPIIRLVKQANSGVSGARNHGLSEAVGEFVLFVDGDDWLLPTALEHLGSLADSNPKASLFFGRSQRVSQSTREAFGESSAVAGDFYSRILVSCFAQHPAQVLIRREALSREKFRSFTYPAEDFDLYLRLLTDSQPLRLKNWFPVIAYISPISAPTRSSCFGP